MSYEETKKRRLDVGNMTGFSTSIPRKCVFCQQKADIITENGKQILKCRSGCRDQELQPQNQNQNNNSKFGTKYGNAQNRSNSFIVSQKRRRYRTDDNYVEEDRDWLRGMFNSESVSLVDSAEMDTPSS